MWKARLNHHLPTVHGEGETIDSSLGTSSLENSKILGRYLIYIVWSLEIYGLIMFLKNFVQPKKNLILKKVSREQCQIFHNLLDHLNQNIGTPTKG